MKINIFIPSHEPFALAPFLQYALIQQTLPQLPFSFECVHFVHAKLQSAKERKEVINICKKPEKY